jgi:TP901 family phage tail tape measure protein
MANQEQVKNFEVGLGLTEDTLRQYSQLKDVLGVIYGQLTKVKQAAAEIQISGVGARGPNDPALSQQLAALQAELRTLLGSIRSGGPNAQLNSAIISGQQQQKQFSDGRLDLESARVANAQAERRVMLAKQENIAAEAKRQYNAEEIGMTREIEQATLRVAAAQRALTQARLEEDTIAEGASKRAIRDSQQRLQQIREELELRERGARVRLGNSLDSGTDASSAQAQLKAVQEARASLSDSIRNAAGAIRTAENEANRATAQKAAPVSTAHSAALREDRTRDYQSQLSEADVGPPVDLYYKELQRQARAREAAAEKAQAEERAAFERIQSQIRPAQVEDRRRQQEAEELAAQIGPPVDLFYKELQRRSRELTAAAQKAKQLEQAEFNRQQSQIRPAQLEDRKRQDQAEQMAAQIGPPVELFYAELQKRVKELDAARVKAEQEMQKQQEAFNKAGAKYGPDRNQLLKLRDAQMAKEQQQQESNSDIRQRRHDLTLGDGGASIAMTQAALTTNYFVTQGIVQAFKSAIQFTVEYEEALAHLKTIAGATEGQLGDLRATVEGVSNVTRYGAVDLTKAAAALSETGVTVSQMGVALKGVADLATATGEDFNKTVDTVTGALGAFKLSATDTVDITNMIAQAVNSSRLTMDKLKTSIETAGETASEAGVSFKEMLAANVAITNTGTASGATLGGGLRSLLTDLEKPSDKFKATLERVGLTEDDINVKTQGLYGAMSNLHDAGFDAADAMQSFDARAASAFTALSGNLKAFAEFETGLNSTDAAARANADQMKTLGAQYDRFKNQTSLLVGEGFKPLLDGFKSVVSLTADAETSIRSMSFAVEAAGTVLGGATIALGTQYVGKLGGGLIGLATGGFAAAEGMAAIGASLGLWVGVAAAAAAGVAFLINRLGDSKKAFEDQMTAVNTAKDTLTESKQAYDSIGTTIETLTDKMDALNKHPEMLKREIDDVGKQFEKYGEQLDKSAIQKTEDLITVLKKLHDQLGQKYELSTVMLGQQLDLMTVQAQQKVQETNSQFGRNAFNGATDKVDRVRPARSTEYVEGTVGGLAGDDSTYSLLPNGKQSKGFADLGTGLNSANLAPFVQLLGDVGVKELDKVTAGFKAALDPNATADVGNDPEKAQAYLNLLGQANTGLTAAQIKLGQQRNAVGTDDATKARIDALVQIFGNAAEQLKKSVEAGQTLAGNLSQKAVTSADVANIQYENNNPGAVARRTEIEKIIQRSVGLRTAGFSSNRDIDDIWAAQIQAESRGKQFDANGRTLTSSKGAMGVAQVRLSTGPEAARLAGEDWNENKFRNDAAYNEKLGKAYMSHMLDLYGGNNTLALAGYNWGQGNVNNLLKQKNPDKTTNDFRVLSNNLTESDFIDKLPPETQRYIARIGGSGAGNVGRFERLNSNIGVASQVRDLNDLVQSLTAQRDANKGNAPEVASIEKQIVAAKTELAAWEKKFDDARVSAAPALKKASSADEAALNARVKALDAQAGNSRNIDEVQEIGKQADDTIAAVYGRKIDTLRAISPKVKTADGTLDYTSEVRQQIESLQNERDEKLKAQDEAIKKHITSIKDALDKAELKKNLEAEAQTFKDEMSDLKQRQATESTAHSISLKQAAQPLKNDQSQASYMSDPRYSARFSQVQRTALSFQTAADSDLKDQATLAEDRRHQLQLQAEEEQAKAAFSRTGSKLTDRQDALAQSSDDKEQARVQQQINQLLDEQRTQEEKVTAASDKRKKNAEDILELEEKIKSKNAAPMGLMDGINAANANFLQQHDLMANAIDGYNSLLGSATNSFAQFFDDIVTGSKSAGQAIGDFARSFLKAMLQILEQQAALATVKAIISAFGGAFGPSATPAAGSGSAPVATGGFDSAGTAFAIQGGSVGNGIVTRGGGFTRFAGGGSVNGSMTTRDSVNALLKPGEYVLNSDATDMVGTDFLDGLNSKGNRMISKSTPAPLPKRDTKPSFTNVWVVAPDQKPQMGPSDVVAIMSDDIMRGGTTKQLIKQVAMGQ